jgi:hypothetical protein
MAQVDSENTTVMPIDPTRRHLLTIVAGGAVAAAIPADARAYPGQAADPIFAAIEAHRKINAVAQADWAEVTRLYELADKKVGKDRKDAREAIRVGAENAVEEGPNAEACALARKFAETVPTTLPGLLAMIVYANELDDQDPEVFNDCQQSLATAAQALMNNS